MFELSVAIKYLLPKKHRLSTSLISLLSIFVISLVVWLVLVFLSVTSGIEKNWLDKLTSLNAPIRISPSNNYYSSYYYKIDSHTAASDFTLKTIREKNASTILDPYDPNLDSELPYNIGQRIKIDPVKKAYQVLKNIDGLTYQDYELSAALLKLTMQRASTSMSSQMSYVLSLSDQNPNLSSLIIPPTIEDLQNVITHISSKDELIRFFTHINIDKASLMSYSKLEMPTDFPVKLDLESLEKATSKDDVLYITGKSITIPFKDLKIVSASPNISFEKSPDIKPLWAYHIDNVLHIPSEDGLMLPKVYRKSGALVGDTGSLNYTLAGITGMQEQRLPFKVVGFYNPGVLPIGSRSTIASYDLAHTLYASSKDFTLEFPSNGIFVWFKDLNKAMEYKEKIEKSFLEEGIAEYWNVESFRDFSFSKDLLNQFQSDRTLFTLVAAIILLVACCNIISLLILLVNDKRKEIAILQALGASRISIASIFGLCGVIMGLLSSAIGIALGMFTLKYIDTLVSILTSIQGNIAFNPVFFGDKLPSAISHDALMFILITTPLLSLVAGLIPAIKAACTKPSNTLRMQ